MDATPSFGLHGDGTQVDIQTHMHTHHKNQSINQSINQTISSTSSTALLGVETGAADSPLHDLKYAGG